MCEQPPYSLLVRAIERDVLPVCQHYGMGVITWSPLAGGWLSGHYRRDQEAPSSTRSERLPGRYDLRLPENQRKLDAADAFAALAEEAGVSLIHLALAFVLRHPAVSSAIIGPRTLEHLESQLAATELVLSDELLDRLDAVVAPGTNLNPADSGYQPPALAASARRR
jgi:aryl-alcohol dehydrogenase-like predicted oxidoreductase